MTKDEEGVLRRYCLVLTDAPPGKLENAADELDELKLLAGLLSRIHAGDCEMDKGLTLPCCVKLLRAADKWNCPVAISCVGSTATRLFNEITSSVQWVDITTTLEIADRFNAAPLIVAVVKAICRGRRQKEQCFKDAVLKLSQPGIRVVLDVMF